MKTHRECISMTHLPACAPELNPVEYPWAYCKEHELPNFCPKDVWRFGHFASQVRSQAHPPQNQPAPTDRRLLETGCTFLILMSRR
jgi:hypothetical protein